MLRWHKVSKRKPAYSTTVIVWTKFYCDGKFTYEEWDREFWHSKDKKFCLGQREWESDFGHMTTKITHWAYQPQKPMGL